MVVDKQKVLEEFIRMKSELIQTQRQEQKIRLEDAAEDDDTNTNLVENPVEETLAIVEQSSKALDRLAEELDHLKLINIHNIHEEVEPNALVITDSIGFLIGVNQAKLTVENREFYGISTEAPIYEALKGLKIDDQFTFNNKSYKILDIC